MNGFERLYRTRDGTGLYRFWIEPVGAAWHAVILGSPSYGARPADLESTHRLRRGDGSLIVCWDPLPTDARTAQNLAVLWAECTQAYLASGRFGDPGALPPVERPAKAANSISYRTLDGTSIYQFSIERSGSVWRSYILAQPSYTGRATSATSTHRLGLGAGRPFVCWLPEPTSEKVAKAVSRTWAEATQHYIDSGSFPSPDSIPAAGGAGFRAEDRTVINRFRASLLRLLG